MSFKVWVSAVLYLSIPVLAVAQTVKIKAETITYNRKGKDVPDDKKSFSISKPVIVGEKAAEIAAAMSYEKAFHINLAEQIAGEDYWLDSCDFTVDYNKNGLLSVTLAQEGSGAYPSESTVHLTIHSAKGTRIISADVFVDLDSLAALVRKEQLAEIRKARQGTKKKATEFDDLFRDAKFTAENLGEFTVSDAGITFHYDYGFPHVVLSQQPPGKYLVSWDKLRPFLKKDGTFGRFLEKAVVKPMSSAP